MFSSKLTKKFFMGIPEGKYLASKLLLGRTQSVFAEEVAALPDKPAQWNRIKNAGAAHRMCHIFRNESDYDSWTHWLARGVYQYHANVDIE